MSLILPIADALVAELNAELRPWHGEFTAERDLAPTEELEKNSAGLSVLVVPFTVVRKKLDRSQVNKGYQSLIVFRERVGKDIERFAALLDLVEAIADYFDTGTALGAMPNVKPQEVEHRPIYDATSFRGTGVFDARLWVTCRVWRSA